MMSLKRSKNSEIHKILLVTLSNIGDVVLTFPVIDILRKDFPDARLSVVVGPKGEALLKGNSCIDRLYIFDKHQSWIKSLAWLMELRHERYDLAVDLRNTAIPLLIGARQRTSLRAPRTGSKHMREKHLQKLRTAHIPTPEKAQRCAVHISQADKQFADQVANKEIGVGGRYWIVAPGAADSSKRWPEERFAALCDALVRDHHLKIVFAGGDEDKAVIARIQKIMAYPAVDVSGRASLTQLAALLKACAGAVVNDSAPMHLASYLDVPVIAIFGPTDPGLYGPWGAWSRYLRNNTSCLKCARPKEEIAHTCMGAVTVEDVLAVFPFDAVPSSGNGS